MRVSLKVQFFHSRGHLKYLFVFLHGFLRMCWISGIVQEIVFRLWRQFHWRLWLTIVVLFPLADILLGWVWFVLLRIAPELVGTSGNIFFFPFLARYRRCSHYMLFSFCLALCSQYEEILKGVLLLTWASTCASFLFVRPILHHGLEFFNILFFSNMVIINTYFN